MITEDIEHRAGLTDNHAAKVESGGRVPGLDLLLLIVEMLSRRVRLEWGESTKLKRPKNVGAINLCDGGS